MSALYRCISSSEYRWQRQLLRSVEGLGIQTEEMQIILFNLQEKKNYGVIFIYGSEKTLKIIFALQMNLFSTILKKVLSLQKRGNKCLVWRLKGGLWRTHSKMQWLLSWPLGRLFLCNETVLHIWAVFVIIWYQQRPMNLLASLVVIILQLYSSNTKNADRTVKWKSL